MKASRLSFFNAIWENLSPTSPAPPIATDSFNCGFFIFIATNPSSSFSAISNCDENNFLSIPCVSFSNVSNKFSLKRYVDLIIKVVVRICFGKVLKKSVNQKTIIVKNNPTDSALVSSNAPNRTEIVLFILWWKHPGTAGNSQRIISFYFCIHSSVLEQYLFI